MKIYLVLKTLITMIIIISLGSFVFVKTIIFIVDTYHKHIEKQYPEIMEKHIKFNEISESYHNMVLPFVWDIEDIINKKRNLIPRATIQEKENLSIEIENLKVKITEIEDNNKDLIKEYEQTKQELNELIDNVPNKKHKNYFHYYGYYIKYL